MTSRVVECQAQSASGNSSAEPTGVLNAIAEEIAANARKAGCGRIECKILVADLTTVDGSTSQFGVQFSDEMSKALAGFLQAEHVLDRSVLRTFFQEQRIPSKLLSEPLPARWMGKKLGATMVVLPGLDYAHGSEVSFKLVEVGSGAVFKSNKLGITFATSGAYDLRAADGYGPLGSRAASPANEPTYKLGPKNPGIKLPQCFYSPNPEYSASARNNHFGGTTLVEAIISKEGRVVDPRVVRGLPHDLNEMALATITTWRCRPAVLDGNPVAVVVPFEITFRPN
jgi:TonB family protein